MTPSRVISFAPMHSTHGTNQMNEQADEMTDQPKVQKIIEMKFPITWLIGTAGVLLSLSAAAYFKFDGYGKDIQTLTKTVETLASRTETRDDRITAVMQEIIQVKASQTNLVDRLQRAESDLKDSRNTVEEVRRNQRWMPK